FLENSYVFPYIRSQAGNHLYGMYRRETETREHASYGGIEGGSKAVRRTPVVGLRLTPQRGCQEEVCLFNTATNSCRIQYSCACSEIIRCFPGVSSRVNLPNQLAERENPGVR